MPNSVASQTLFLYSTTVSDVGTVRSNNQDSAFAGEHLIAICDGMGGHAGELALALRLADDRVVRGHDGRFHHPGDGAHVAVDVIVLDVGE